MGGGTFDTIPIVTEKVFPVCNFNIQYSAVYHFVVLVARYVFFICAWSIKVMRPLVHEIVAVFCMLINLFSAIQIGNLPSNRVVNALLRLIVLNGRI